MKKPERRTLKEIQEKHYFVDFLFETYQPKKNSAGEYFHNGLDYFTNEAESYMASAEEKEYIEINGIASIGFLEILRKEMAITSGFGICITNRDLKKAMMNIVIDYGIQQEEAEKYYDILLDGQFIFTICDSKGNEYVTTIQQIFNWEYKMWTRASNNAYQKKKRSKEKENNDLGDKAVDDEKTSDFTVNSSFIDFNDLNWRGFDDEKFSGFDTDFSFE